MKEMSQFDIARDGKRIQRRLGFLFMIPLLVGMIALFLLSAEWKETLRVQTIYVNGSQSVSVKDVAGLAEVLPHTELYHIDLLEVQNRIMAQPFIKSARVNRRLPGTVAIEVIEREPIASVNVGKPHLVDAEGVMLPDIGAPKKFDVPGIIGIDGLRPERAGVPIMNKELFNAIDVLKEAIKIDSVVYRMISEVDMNHGGEIILYSSDVGVPVLLGREGVPKKLLMLETFWSRFVSSGDVEKLGYVDLRFDDQVVVHWNQEAETRAKKMSL